MNDRNLEMIFTGRPIESVSNPFEQDLFIIEKMETKLDLVEKGDEYVLEGIAAIFGQENNNHRIYEEAEYLPHLEYLQEKIKAKRLLGELDHPEKFDISLQNISHIIESLDYMKDQRQVKIRVRLLNTPAGRIAKTLVDAGVPVSISSRAAGSVRENKKVQIKKIFTYDLVADPGFEKAQLQRVYESANYNEADSAKNSIVSRLDEIPDDFFGKNDNVKIYSIKESDMSMFKKAIENDKKNPSEMTKSFVTVEEMNDYSALIKKELDTIKSTATDPATVQLIEKLDGRLAKLEGYTKYLAENLDKNIQYSEYLAENLDKDIEYTKYLAENLDRNISFADYLAENLEKNISYSEYLAENLDRNISYSEYLAENLDKNISYSEYLAENLDRNISYSEYLAENLDRNISYSQYLSENLDRNISYSEYLAENLDRGIGYSEYLAEKLERNIAYSEYIAENVNTATTVATTNVEETPAAAAEVVSESTKPLFDKTNYSSLSESINALLESANNQRAMTKLHETKYPFFRFLSEGKREEFLNLDEAKKEKVLGALRNGAYFSEADITKKWDAAIVENVSTEPLFMQLMPENVKPIWESLSDEERSRTFAASKLKKLDTEYQVRNFWSTRPFIMGKHVGLIKLDENQTPIAAPAKTTSAFTTEYMDGVAAELGKRFRK